MCRHSSSLCCRSGYRECRLRCGSEGGGKLVDDRSLVRALCLWSPGMEMPLVTPSVSLLAACHSCPSLREGAFFSHL